MSDSIVQSATPEARQLIAAATDAYEAQQALYAKEEADRWAAMHEALQVCAAEMQKREAEYAAAMGVQ